MARVFAIVLGFLSQTFSYPSQVWFSANLVRVNNGQVITPELSNSIQATLDVWNITGLSVAIVPKSGEPEYRSWGNRTEDGEKITEEVWTAQVSVGVKSEAALTDILFHMASVSRHFARAHLAF
jgi:hypothetical protein